MMLSALFSVNLDIVLTVSFNDAFSSIQCKLGHSFIVSFNDAFSSIQCKLGHSFDSVF